MYHILILQELRELRGERKQGKGEGEGEKGEEEGKGEEGGDEAMQQEPPPPTPLDATFTKVWICVTYIQ